MAKTYDFDDFCQITEMLRKKEGGCRGIFPRRIKA